MGEDIYFSHLSAYILIFAVSLEPLRLQPEGARAKPAASSPFHVISCRADRNPVSPVATTEGSTNNETSGGAEESGRNRITARAQQGVLRAEANGRPTDPALDDFSTTRLLFLPGKCALTSESLNDLRRAATWLQRRRGIRVLVAGFCDPLGSDDCTHDLGQRRSVTVQELLVKYGVAPSQIIAAKGWEGADPVCEEATTACQQLNRRVRIFIARAGRSPGSRQ